MAIEGNNQYTFFNNNDGIEPSLLLKNETRLDIPLPNVSFEFLTFLEYQIKANPNNLKPYIQRIFLCRHITLNKFLAGSLADLFIELNTKGIKLKKRMLGICRPFLEEHEFSVFLTVLKNTHKKIDEFQQFEHSIHVSQLLGNTKIIDHTKPIAIETEASVIDLANAYVEHGQLEDAIDILTDKVLANPQNSLVGEALTELLIASKNKVHFNHVLSTLKQSTASLPDCWGTTEAIMLRC